MKYLVLEEFDLHEFNKWMLDIQKIEQEINYVLNFFEKNMVSKNYIK